MAKQKNFEYYVSLPSGINISGYENLRLTGKTRAISEREAVSHLISRQIPKDRKKIASIMNELDINYGGAENYAFPSQLEFPEIIQDKEELRAGQKLNFFEKKLLQEHALAYNLAVKNKADIRNPEIKFNYLSKARLLKRH